MLPVIFTASLVFQSPFVKCAYRFTSNSLRPSQKSFGRFLFAHVSAIDEEKTIAVKDKEVQNVEKPRVMFVLGGPGAGKGTQCEKLSSEFGMTHLSAGDLLRQERISGTANGQLIDNYLKEGKILPVKITLDLLRRAMETSNSNRFLIDGFPRNWDNINGWNQFMNGVCIVEAVLFIDCPEDELERRLLSRGVTSGRSDDNLESARKRFRTFNEATLPVVKHYEQENLLIKVSGAQSVNDVYEELHKAVLPFIEREILDNTQTLLNAIVKKDWNTFVKFTSSDISCIEEETKGHIVSGLEFHKFYFDKKPDNKNKITAHILEPVIRVMGTTAVISYIRINECQSNTSINNGDDSFNNIVTTPTTTTTRHRETRVWQLIKGGWKQVHFHRS